MAAALLLVLVGMVAKLGLGLGLVASRSDNHGGLSPECVAGLKQTSDYFSYFLK